MGEEARIAEQYTNIDRQNEKGPFFMGKDKQQETREMKNQILFGNSKYPKDILGCKKTEDGWKICTFYPKADKVTLHNRKNGESYQMVCEEKGFFHLVLAGEETPDYYLEADLGEKQVVYEDVYRFSSFIKKEDYLAFENGENTQMQKILGAHFSKREGVLGTYFAVYAPHAGRVSVVGEWNDFNGLLHPMQKMEEGGIFELFIPQARSGMKYQYEIKTSSGVIQRKADPYSYQQDLKKREYSIIPKEEEFFWKDRKYLESRGKQKAVLIYQVYPLCYKKRGKKGNLPLTYRQLARDLADYMQMMGYTHVQLKGILESSSSDDLSSQVQGYFAPASQYGTREDFKYFVDYLHRKNIGVYLEWQIAGFGQEVYGLARFDGTPLYEYEDDRLAVKAEKKGMLFHFGKPKVQSFLLSSCRFWMEEYHIDGFFIQDLASMLYQDYGKIGGEWVANPWGGKENLDAISFLKKCTSFLKNLDQSVEIMVQDNSGWAGVTTSTERGGLGFDLQWNSQWLMKFLDYLKPYPFYRKYDFWKMEYETAYHFHSQNILTVSYHENVLWNGTLIQKMPGEYFSRFACLRVLYGYMMGYSGRKLFFMGEDFAHWHPCNTLKELDWYLLEEGIHQSFHEYMKELFLFYRSHKVLWEQENMSNSFEWCHTKESEYGIFSFVRKSLDGKGNLLFLFHLRTESGKGYLLTVPEKTEYYLVFHTDHSQYGGIGTGDDGIVISPVSSEQTGEQPYMILDLPPLSMMIFEYNLEE